MKAALPERARLLIRVPSWLGDLVMAEPVLRAADRRGDTTIVGPARLLALFEGRFERCDRLNADAASAWRGHDAALLLTGSFRSAWIAAQAGIPVRAGLLRDARGLLLTHAMRPSAERGSVPLGLGVAGRGRRWLPRPFGGVCAELAALVGLEVEDRRPRIRPDASARDSIRARLEAQGVARGAPFVVANVGSRPGSAKGAPFALWSAVLAAFAQRSKLRVVLVAGPGEEHALAGVVAAGIPASTLALAGPAPDLRELPALLAESALVITADNGPRHLATAVGAPVVVLCGPTDPRHTADHLE
ncbi:MAG TPA: glycosyltransferase family 9 protein, partial [Planctomycetota bacterium]|nr:glycosyltransferase family 9 protein [Planctomycetota bacterium]